VIHQKARLTSTRIEKEKPMPDYRIEKDSMGEMRVPADALYAAQTQRAVENFPISGLRFPRAFLRALGLVKAVAAPVNQELGLLDDRRSRAIQQAAREVVEGRWDEQFPIDIFQTGSGTSTNMNANEVIASRALQILGQQPGSKEVHPNDHVNLGQSSNDVIPAVIHVAAALEVKEQLLPALEHLREVLQAKAREFDDIVKTGRTHLMDATPVRLGQEFGGYASQIEHGIRRIQSALAHLSELAIGGTAVGTGVNTHPEFGAKVAAALARETGIPFREAENHFEAQAAQDAAVELSGQLKTVATSLMKIANDLRWMNSGPQCGLQEVALPALQPGSSIMPGKVNPVIPEVVAMVAAQVTGNDVAITIGGQSGSFELNVMLPLIARNLLESINLLATSSRALADRAIAGLKPNREHMQELLERNAILATSLAPLIGYDRAAQVIKQAQTEGRRVRDVARELKVLPEDQLNAALDTRAMTEGGFHGGSGGG
jgi:fumarate hydratase, class II